MKKIIRSIVILNVSLFFALTAGAQATAVKAETVVNEAKFAQAKPLEKPSNTVQSTKPVPPAEPVAFKGTTLSTQPSEAKVNPAPKSPEEKPAQVKDPGKQYVSKSQVIPAVPAVNMPANPPAAKTTTPAAPAQQNN